MTSAPGPSDVATRFIEAIRWGEHTVVWNLLSDIGKSHALSVALANGMDRVAASRIQADTAEHDERDDFLRQLLHGLVRDLRSVDIDELSADASATQLEDGSMAVELRCPSSLPGHEFWPAGRLLLSADGDRSWCIDRLEPIIAGP